MKIFNLPDLGEGLPDAEIHAWHVAEGDSVKQDQLLVSVETAKAVVDVPSPYTGVIKKLYAKAGDVVATGAPLVEFATDQANEPKSHDKGSVAGQVIVGNTLLEENPMGIIPVKTAPTKVANALPAVRNLARQLGIDLTQIKASCPSGAISIADVKQAARFMTPESVPVNTPPPEGYQVLRGVRRAMAQAMVQSHREVVPVTIIDDAKLSQWKKKQDITGRIVRALCHACTIEPALNAWFDTASMSRQLMKSIDVGLALDSADGLFVPVIKNASELSAKKCREIIDLFKQQVADRSIAKENLRDPTIMLSNFGMFAGRYATPIIVPPLVAILGCGKLADSVVAIEGKAEVHRVLPLSLTFDHRAVTGGEATRFLAGFICDIEKPS